MRFINADTYKGTIEDSTTLNNYAYANGDPISLVDPLGKSAELQITNKSYSLFDDPNRFFPFGTLQFIDTKTPPPSEVGYVPPKNPDKSKSKVPAQGHVERPVG